MEPRCYNHQNGGHDERYDLSSDDDLFEEVRRRNETKSLSHDDLSLISLFAYRLCYKVRSTTYGIYRDDSLFSLSRALPIYIIRSAIYNKECAQGDFPRMHTSGN